jgi:flagellar hook-associated protein 3 FlgL
LTVKAANSTNDTDALEAIRKEVHELRSHLLTITNTQFGGKYIFSGTKTDTATFDAAELWQGNNTAVDYEIGVGVKVPVNITADNVFKDAGGPGAPNVFQDLATLESDLIAGNFAGIGSGITRIDKWLDNVNSARAEVGARANRLDFVKTRLEDISLNFHDLLSKTEDADIAQVITNLKMQENVYRASLSAGARIIQPSLIDFLR